MASSISGMPAFDPGMLAAMREKMFTKIDADGDGSLTQAELETAAPKDGKGPSASKLIEDFDADGDGALSKTEMDAGFKKIDDRMRSTFLQMQEEASNESGVDIEELFASLDADGDGALSKTELEDGAETLKEAFGPPSGPPPGGGPRGPGGPPPAAASEETQEEEETAAASSETENTLFDELDTNKDGTVSASELAAGEDKIRDKLKQAFGPPPLPAPESSAASQSGEEETATSSAASARQEMMSFLLSLQEQLQAA